MKKTTVVILSILIALLILGVFFAYALVTKSYTDSHNEVTGMVELQEKTKEENERLVSDIAVLKQKERIERLATEELGMHKADAEEIVRMDVENDR